MTIVLLRKTLFTTCLTVSLLCLTAGYGVVGGWVGAAIAAITGYAWLLARKYPASGLPFICLMVSVCLAAAGQLVGAPSLLMICGSGLALAVWDLVLLEGALRGNQFGEQTRRYEIKHLQALALALGPGLSVPFIGRLLTLRIPFVLLMILVVLVPIGLDRIGSYIKKRSVQIS